MEYMGIEPQMVYFKSCFFQANLEEIEESFREKTLFIENKKLGRKEDIFQISVLFGYTDVLYNLLQKAKKMVTWCGVFLRWEQGGEMEIPVERRRKARGTARKCFNPCPSLQFLSEAKQDNTHYVVCW